MTFAPEIEELLSKPTVSVVELAKIFGLSRNGAYAAVERGDFETIRVGKKAIRVLTVPLRRKLGLQEDSNAAINC